MQNYDNLNEVTQIRKIIHIDMDAFFASVEQLDNAELKGKPVAVSGGTQRGVVAAASYEARRYGIKSAMSNAEALRRCPHIIFVKPRFRRYKAISNEIMQLFREYTDLVEPLSIDEAFLDVTNNKQQQPYAMIIAEEIRRRIKEEIGLTASAGVSYNKFLAKTASDVNKPDGMFVITPKRARAFLDLLPIRKFYGVGSVTAKKMQRMGISKGRDLLQFSEKDLTRHFGKIGRFYYLIAQGEDPRPVNVNRQRKSIGTEETFLTDLTDREQATEALRNIVKELHNRTNSKDVAGYTLTLKVKYSDFQKHSRSKTYLQPLNNIATIENAALALWDKVSLKQGIRLLGLSISKLQNIKNIPQKRQQKLDLFSES